MKHLFFSFLLLLVTFNVKAQKNLLVKERYNILVKDTIISKTAKINQDFEHILLLLNNSIGNDSIFNRSTDLNEDVNFLNKQFKTDIFSKAQYLRFASFLFGANKDVAFSPMTFIEINFESGSLERAYNVIKRYPQDYFVIEFTNKFKYFKWKNSIYILSVEGGEPQVFENFYNDALKYIKNR